MTLTDRILARIAALIPRTDQPTQVAISARGDATPVSLAPLWSNAYTGLGTTERDRTAWHSPGALTPIPDETLSELWQGDSIAATGIEAIVDDGMRSGFQICYRGEVESDKKKIQDVTDLADGIDLLGNARLAAKSARGLRGGGLAMSTNGGRMMAGRPLDEERVTSVDRLITWDSRDLRVASWRYDQHLAYWYSPVSQSLIEEGWGSYIHASHMVVFPGLDTPLRDRQQRWDGWYKPVLQHVVEKIRDFMQSHQSAVAMLQDGSQGVLSLPNLSQTIATVGRSVLETRLSLIQLYRWIGRIMPLDAGGGAVPPEKFEWVERSFNGIADLLNSQMPLVAQSLGMPMTRLWGDFSTAGLNNAGAGAERNWLVSVDAYRVAKIQPGIERIVRLLAKQAGAKDWRRFGIEWPELEVLSSTERATLEKTEAEVDDLRIQQGFPPERILEHRFGQGEYSHTPPLLTEGDLDDITTTQEVANEMPQPTAFSQSPEQGTTPESVAANAVPPDSALNGAQVSALLEVVQQVVAGLLPRASAVEIIVTAFPVSRQMAERILGEVGRGFEPTVAVAPEGETQKAVTVAAEDEPEGEEPEESEPDDDDDEGEE